MKRVLVTGAAGFIGFHLALALKKRGDFVLGFDNFNAYYSPLLKRKRAKILKENQIKIIEGDLVDQSLLENIVQAHSITHIVHLAAQAGVRYSFQAPKEYVHSNMHGFLSILETCRAFPGVFLTYASSSSVYGANTKIPFSEEDVTDDPINLYSASKKSNELMARSYHHLYNISVTGLRYFTVYGPWGRPDMAYFSFAEKIHKNIPIQLFNFGNMKRDFTYIDDIIQGTIAALDLESPCEIFNLGHNRPIEINYLVDLLENALGKKAIRELMPMQKGEVEETFADIEKSKKMLKFSPLVSLEEGISQFVSWLQTGHFSEECGRDLENSLPK